MKKIQIHAQAIRLCLSFALFSLLITHTAMAKTEQIILKQDLGLGEEAIIFNTKKGEVILNYYALPEKVAQQIDQFKKGQCLEIQSKHGFYNDTGDGQYIQSIRPCKTKSSLARPKVTQ